jgi:hypothetical protein
MENWTENSKQAERQSRQLPRDMRAPPHWLRCTYFNDAGERCRHGDGHGAAHEVLAPKSYRSTAAP